MKPLIKYLSVFLVCFVFISTSKAQQVIEKGSFEAVQFITPNNSGMDLETDIYWYKVKFPHNTNLSFKFTNPKLLAINWRGKRHKTISGISQLESVKGTSDNLPVKLVHSSISGLGITVELEYQSKTYTADTSISSASCNDDPSDPKGCGGMTLQAVLPYELTQNQNFEKEVKVKAVAIKSVYWSEYTNAAALCR